MRSQLQTLNAAEKHLRTAARPAPASGLPEMAQAAAGVFLANEELHLQRQFASLHLAIETLGQGILEATPQGQIRWATMRARQLLAICANGAARTGQLPGILRSWVARHPPPAALGRFPSPDMVIRRDGRQVLVRLARTRGRCWLFLEEQRGASVADVLEPVALTHRECDVLGWLAEGKSNADIGHILGISPRTVQKHLERIYQKLGVETRTAAAARALELIQHQAS